MTEVHRVVNDKALEWHEMHWMASATHVYKFAHTPAQIGWDDSGMHFF